MTSKKGQNRNAYIKEMFNRISGQYDLMNRLMTFGRDLAWRRLLVAIAELPKNGRVLDVGTGTGDVAFEFLRFYPTSHVIGVDFSIAMINKGRERPGGRRIRWCQGDALQLPFPDSTFDAVTSGFLVRNVMNVRAAFEEQIRVIRPGGRVVCLDTSPVPKNILRPLAMFHLKILIPFLGKLITGEKGAYQYLPKSTLNFMEPNEIAKIMTELGLKKVGFRRLMFGIISVVWGKRPK